MTVQGLLSRIFHRKDANKHQFTPEERALAQERRLQNVEQRLAERQLEHQNRMLQLKQNQAQFMANIANISGKGDGDDADDMFKGFMEMLVASKMQQAQNPQQQAPTQEPTPQQEFQGISFTDEEIDNFIKAQPRYKIIAAKKMTDETLAKTILAEMPNITEECLERCIHRFRSL
jgi:ERCC4-type nuclease